MDRDASQRVTQGTADSRTAASERRWVDWRREVHWTRAAQRV